jgi:hypothetical protein
MKRFLAAAAVPLVAALAVSGCGHQLPSMGWVSVIDGERGLDNFNRVGDANWRAEGGVIVADKGKGGHLVSKASYKDFELRAEFWSEVTTNSGIFIRCKDANKISAVDCYEVNIADGRPEPNYGTGGIPNVAAVKVVAAPKAAGRWNVYEIMAKGDELTIVLNGQVTVYARDGRNPAGPFTLQYGGFNSTTKAGGGAIKWRKLDIRPL